MKRPTPTPFSTATSTRSSTPILNSLSSSKSQGLHYQTIA
jgi:hypothetical protein